LRRFVIGMRVVRPDSDFALTRFVIGTNAPTSPRYVERSPYRLPTMHRNQLSES
jgi:hypothetical protein